MKFNPPHKVIGTFAIFCLLMFSLFGCFRKKNAKVTLGSWLETHFPGQFEVVQSNLNLNVMDLYYGRKLALIADKADPEVQWMVNWQKDATDLGLNVAEVQAASDSARSDVAQARALFGLLKNAGLERFSVGVIGPAAYVLVFGQPDAATRQHILATLLPVLDARKNPAQTSIWVELLEEQAYGQQFNDIIPRGHWQTARGWNEDQKIMSIDFEWKKGLSAETLIPHWKINSASLRSGGYMDDAYRQALVWAEKKLPKPFYLESEHLVYVEQAEGLAIRYSFPCFDAKPPEGDSTAQIEPKFYVSGLYRTEQKVLSEIKKRNDL